MNMRFTLSTLSGKPVQILQMNPYTVGALIDRQVLGRSKDDSASLSLARISYQYLPGVWQVCTI